MKRLLVMGFWLGVWSGVLAGTSAWAGEGAEKPAKRSATIELNFSTQGFNFKFSSGPAMMPTDCPTIDTVCPTLMPAYVEVLLRHIGQSFTQPFTADAPSDARKVFDQAELYRMFGRLAMARKYYQRVHLLEPTTRLGRLAIERLQAIEERLREAEQSGDDDPEMVYREIQRQSIPLGLVDRSY